MRIIGWAGTALVVVAPLVLSVVGVILITVSGWLGGALVFKHGVAVNPQYERGVKARDEARAS